MTRQQLKNISLSDFTRFLKKAGCKKIRSKGGHDIYKKEGLVRPIVVQSHVNPVPEFIIKNAFEP